MSWSDSRSTICRYAHHIPKQILSQSNLELVLDTYRKKGVSFCIRPNAKRLSHKTKGHKSRPIVDSTIRHLLNQNARINRQNRMLDFFLTGLSSFTAGAALRNSQ